MQIHKQAATESYILNRLGFEVWSFTPLRPLRPPHTPSPCSPCWLWAQDDSLQTHLPYKLCVNQTVQSILVGYYMHFFWHFHCQTLWLAPLDSESYGAGFVILCWAANKSSTFPQTGFRSTLVHWSVNTIVTFLRRLAVFSLGGMRPFHKLIMFTLCDKWENANKKQHEFLEVFHCVFWC